MLEPIRFAGTCKQYSKKAIPQEMRMTRISGQPSEMCISCSFRCPYQAKVIQIFEPISNRIVQKALQFIFTLLFSAVQHIDRFAAAAAES